MQAKAQQDEKLAAIAAKLKSLTDVRGARLQDLWQRSGAAIASARRPTGEVAEQVPQLAEAPAKEPTSRCALCVAAVGANSFVLGTRTQVGTVLQPDKAVGLPTEASPRCWHLVRNHIIHSHAVFHFPVL